MKYIFFSILTTLAFFHCTSSETARNYVFDCYARFDEQAGRTTAQATLKEGTPNPMPVEPQGGIRYQKVAMTLIPVQGITYQHAYAADYVKDHLFECKTPDAKSLEFTLEMPRLDSGAFTPKIISRKAPATYKWEGTALERGEALVFMWENASKGLTVPVELYQVGSSRSIEFPAVKMAEIPAGNWTYYVVRKKLQKATVGGVAVSGVAEYYTKPQAVKIID